ncbi:hypothetical protein [Pseudoxanthomonas winnipegensis]|uniref:hypothetical protein n=1 Tax=Pseudoxanthomonas winnipegensis TaxID=2480810 RepID=UPI00103E8F49|nr:hypothetical protein [Pseudoxanthomonas winnipegensis]TBV76843.1 hypothetical protein EYC45_01375 [Pseudoxanthomonas winnipegensis]
MSAQLRGTSNQLQTLAGQLNRATRTLPGRCQLTQLVFNAGKPLEQMTVAELLQAAKAVTP